MFYLQRPKNKCTSEHSTIDEHRIPNATDATIPICATAIHIPAHADVATAATGSGTTVQSSRCQLQWKSFDGSVSSSSACYDKQQQPSSFE